LYLSALVALSPLDLDAALEFVLCHRCTCKHFNFNFNVSPERSQDLDAALEMYQAATEADPSSVDILIKVRSHSLWLHLQRSNLACLWKHRGAVTLRSLTFQSACRYQPVALT
jgi:hypothetical protein